MNGLLHLMRAARGALRFPYTAMLALMRAEKAHRSTTAMGASGGTVVVMSPDTARRAVLRRLVAASGYAVAAVPGDAVREQVTGLQPIAVLVDVTYLAPDEAVSLVGALRREVEGPLIGVVGSRDGDVCAALLDAGADDAVRGSITAPELRARLYVHAHPRHAGLRRTPAG